MPTSALHFCSDAVCALQGRDYWARFERFVKTLAWSSDDVYIVTGPLYVPQRTVQGYVMHYPMIGLSHSHKHLCSLHLQAFLFLCGGFLFERQRHRDCHCFQAPCFLSGLLGTISMLYPVMCSVLYVTADPVSLCLLMQSAC